MVMERLVPVEFSLGEGDYPVGFEGYYEDWLELIEIHTFFAFLVQK